MVSEVSTHYFFFLISLQEGLKQNQFGITSISLYFFTQMFGCSRQQTMPVSILFIFLTLHLVVGQSCLTDSGCQNCFSNGFTSICVECKSNYQYNSNAQKCQCKSGYFQSSNTCMNCNYNCETCRNNQSCLTCSAEKNLTFNKGFCVCKNGYGDNGKGACVETIIYSTLITIVASVAASLTFFILILLIVRYFKNQQQQQLAEASPNANSNEQPGNKYEIPPSTYISNVTCSICLQENTFTVTQCGHYFHEKCIGNWIYSKQLNATCPNCINEISPQKIYIWCKKCKEAQLPFQSQFICKDDGMKNQYFSSLCNLCQQSITAQKYAKQIQSSAVNFYTNIA